MRWKFFTHLPGNINRHLHEMDKMSSTEIAFKVVYETNCPFYKSEDEFKLSGNALSLQLDKENTFISTAIVRFPNHRTACRILIGDLINILVQYKNIDKIPPVEMECSGCSGIIRVQMGHEKRLTTPAVTGSLSERMDLVASLLSNFSIFESVDEFHLREIVALIKIRRYPKGSIVLKKGTPAQNFYIIMSGTAEVLDDRGVCLSRLSKGDVFGEMSLISGDPVGATIKVVESATILAIEGPDFRSILNKFPSVQMYLARILTKRLAESNVQRAEEITSGMSGDLSQMSAAELLQALDLSQKTGVLVLTLPKGSAQLLLRAGNLIRADYCDRTGTEAVYEILKEKQGRFKFSAKFPEDQLSAPKLGALMEILLDASRMIDEDDRIAGHGSLPGGQLHAV
jgi:CRP/FNR family transcriptional regulator, cyclic AMP receptor protein